MADLRDRFDRAGIVDALLRQRLVRGDRTLAERFAEKGRTAQYGRGDHLTEQGAWDDDLFFILAGRFDVIINGQSIATREAGEHVGELAGLDRARPRTATLRALDEALVLAVSSRDVNEIAKSDAEFWKAAADVVAERLDQRNAQIGSANEVPRIFVMSSSEAKPVARLVRQELDEEGKMHVHLWDRGTFTLSDYPMSSLEEAIEAADFTIAVVQADDTLVSRSKEVKVARDNVHLEYGLSVGKLGLSRSFLLVDAAEDVRLPSDAAGLTTLRYRGGAKDAMERSVAKACDLARETIEYLGVRRNRRVE